MVYTSVLHTTVGDCLYDYLLVNVSSITDLVLHLHVTLWSLLHECDTAIRLAASQSSELPERNFPIVDVILPASAFRSLAGLGAERDHRVVVPLHSRFPSRAHLLNRLIPNPKGDIQKDATLLQAEADKRGVPAEKDSGQA